MLWVKLSFLTPTSSLNLAAPLPIQSPANITGKGLKTIRLCGSLEPISETKMGLLVVGFELAETWLLMKELMDKRSRVVSFTGI